MDSGLLQKLESRGRKYVFVSNIDNMAGTADLNILNKMYRENKEYVLEVTHKTRSDVKGTTLVWYEDNYRLIEVAKVPRDRKWQETVKQKSMFNTNNVWVSMSGIRRVCERGFKDMEVNVNSKTLRDTVSRKEICLENCSTVSFLETYSLRQGGSYAETAEAKAKGICKA